MKRGKRFKGASLNWTKELYWWFSLQPRKKIAIKREIVRSYDKSKFLLNRIKQQLKETANQRETQGKQAKDRHRKIANSLQLMPWPPRHIQTPHFSHFEIVNIPRYIFAFAGCGMSCESIKKASQCNAERLRIVVRRLLQLDGTWVSVVLGTIVLFLILIA